MKLGTEVESESKAKIQSLEWLGWFFHLLAKPTTLAETTLNANFDNFGLILLKLA